MSNYRIEFYSFAGLQVLYYIQAVSLSAAQSYAEGINSALNYASFKVIAV